MLVLPEQIDDECLTDDEVFGFLKSAGVLDGVAVTGGEPLLHADMPEFFFGSCEGAGYKIKLGTNGSNPETSR